MQHYDNTCWPEHCAYALTRLPRTPEVQCWAVNMKACVCGRLLQLFIPFGWGVLMRRFLRNQLLQQRHMSTLNFGGRGGQLAATRTRCNYPLTQVLQYLFRPRYHYPTEESLADCARINRSTHECEMNDVGQHRNKA